MDIIMDLTSFLSSAKRPLIVILGPTASGKTALSLEIAHKIKGEIISADSRQIYQGMRISTDIILPEQQEGIPHHMLEIAPPDKVITVAEYRDMALKIIDKIYKRNHIPILVGGTGLYISAIIEGYNIPRITPDKKLRENLQKQAAKKGVEYLHNKLKKLDPAAAEKIHPNNIRYVIRALEINLSTGKKKNDKKKKSKFDVYMIGIKWPREELYNRINQRVDRQIERGLVEEIKQLLARGYKKDLPAMSSLGVKEIIPYIEGEKSLDECIEMLKQNTRHYAKRQMTWFRRYDNVKWLVRPAAGGENFISKKVKRSGLRTGSETTLIEN